MSGIPGVNSGDDYLYLGNADTSLGAVLGVNLAHPLNPVPLQIIDGAVPPFNVLVNGQPIMILPVGPSTPGSIFINNGTTFVQGTISGTTNEINVVNGPGTITLSTPQPLAPSSNVTFNSVTIAGTPSVTESISNTVGTATPGSAYGHFWEAVCIKQGNLVTFELTDLSAPSGILLPLAIETILALVPNAPVNMRPPATTTCSGICSYNGQDILIGITVNPLGDVIIQAADSGAMPGAVVLGTWGNAVHPFQGLTNNYTYVSS